MKMRMGEQVALVGIIGLLLFIGCATSEKKQTASEAHPQYESLCSKCHTLDRVEVAHKTMTKQQMKQVVERMAKKPNSGIDINSIDHIVSEIF